MTDDLLRAAPLKVDYITSVSIVSDVHKILTEQGYAITDTDNWLVVNDKQDDDASGYIVHRCVLPTQGTVWTCHCGDYRFRQFRPVERGESEPSEVGACKHIQKVQRVAKVAREVDEEQADLSSMGGT